MGANAGTLCVSSQTGLKGLSQSHYRASSAVWPPAREPEGRALQPQTLHRPGAHGGHWLFLLPPLLDAHQLLLPPPFFSIFCSPKLMLLGLSSFINKDKIIWKCQGVGGGGSSHVARSPRPPDSWLAPLPIPFMPKFCSLRAHWLMPLHP